MQPCCLLLSIISPNQSLPVLHQTEIQATLSLFAGDHTPGDREDIQERNVVSRWPINPDKGWILELTGIGYGGEMTIMAAYDNDGIVKIARLLNNSETVGFGKKAEAANYMEIFIGKGGIIPVPTTKNQLGKHADVVSGATITFLGISRAITHGSEMVKEWEKK